MDNLNQLDLFDTGGYTAKPQTNATRNTSRLESRTGTFTDNMKLPVHRWFRYSAGFSAEWAEQVIRELSPSTLLDPFAGSATSLLAADMIGVQAWGYENHPFVARVADSKLQWNQLEENITEARNSILATAKGDFRQGLESIPSLLEKCYTPDSLRQLYTLRDAYLAYANQLSPGVSQIIWLALTSILRPCSHVGTAQWQYVLPNKRKANPLEPYTAFTDKISSMIDDIKILRKIGCSSNSRLLRHDARLIPDEISPQSIDFVITSPPYPNNYDYADATRLEMTFWDEIQGWSDLQKVVRRHLIRACSQHATAERLNLEILLQDLSVSPIKLELTEVCESLAKIRLTKGGKKAYHTMIAAYFIDLAKTFLSLRTLCCSDAKLCFVIGDSAPYGIYVPVDKWLGELALAAGFKSYSFEKLRDRNTKWKNRKHTVPLHEGRLWIEG